MITAAFSIPKANIYLEDDLVDQFNIIEVQLFSMDGTFEKTSYDMSLALSLDASSMFIYLFCTFLCVND